MRKKAANMTQGQKFRSLDDVSDARELLVRCAEEIKVRVVWTDGRPAEEHPMRFDPKELTVDQVCEQYKQALQARGRAYRIEYQCLSDTVDPRRAKGK